MIRKNRRLRAAMQQRIKANNSRKRACGTASNEKSNLDATSELAISEGIFNSSQEVLSALQDDVNTSKEDLNSSQDNRDTSLEDLKISGDGISLKNKAVNISHETPSFSEENSKCKKSGSQKVLQVFQAEINPLHKENSITSRKIEKFAQGYLAISQENACSLQELPDPARLSLNPLQEENISLQEVQNPLCSTKENVIAFRHASPFLLQEAITNLGQISYSQETPISVRQKALHATQVNPLEIPASSHQETMSDSKQKILISTDQEVLTSLRQKTLLPLPSISPSQETLNPANQESPSSQQDMVVSLDIPVSKAQEILLKSRKTPILLEEDLTFLPYQEVIVSSQETSITSQEDLKLSQREVVVATKEIQIISKEAFTSQQEAESLKKSQIVSQKSCASSQQGNDVSTQETPTILQENLACSQEEAVVSPPEALLSLQETIVDSEVYGAGLESNINITPPPPAIEIEISSISNASDEQSYEPENYTTDMDETDDEFTSCPEEPIPSFLTEIDITLAQTVAEYACMFFQF